VQPKKRGLWDITSHSGGLPRKEQNAAGGIEEKMMRPEVQRTLSNKLRREKRRKDAKKKNDKRQEKWTTALGEEGHEKERADGKSHYANNGTTPGQAEKNKRALKRNLGGNQQGPQDVPAGGRGVCSKTKHSQRGASVCKFRRQPRVEGNKRESERKNQERKNNNNGRGKEGEKGIPSKKMEATLIHGRIPLTQGGETKTPRTYQARGGMGGQPQGHKMGKEKEKLGKKRLAPSRPISRH